MLRLTIDTNVIASAFRSSSGASFALIELVRRWRRHPCSWKYEAVVKRPVHLAASGLSVTDVDMALDALAALIEPVATHLSWRPQLGDPDDEMVLEAAVNGRADALVTYNTAHFQAAAARLSVRLARPVEILRKAIET
jgi:predicted nucleic acid-binding protein